MRKVWRGIAGLALLALLYLAFWPIDLQPTTWQPGAAPELRGALASNGKLARAALLAPDLAGPESLAADAAGNLFTGAVDGRIARVDPSGAVQVLAKLSARPLGLRLLPQGGLVVAAERSLLQLHPDGRVETLATHHAGRALRFVDDVEVLPDGTLLFTEASSRFGLHEYELDGLEHRPSGSLFAYDPRTREVSRVRAGFYFANGVAASEDGSYALVNETWAYRVRRVFLSGPRQGESDIVIDNLPGFPDNITRDRERDLFWVALASPRDAGLDALAGLPWLRTAIGRLPRALRPAPKRHAMVVAIRGHGRRVAFFDDPSPDSYSPLTTALAHGDQLYLGSLSHPGIGRVRLPADVHAADRE